MSQGGYSIHLPYLSIHFNFITCPHSDTEVYRLTNGKCENRVVGVGRGT